MSDKKQQDTSEGSIGQSVSTAGLEDSAIIEEAFDMWVDAMMPSFKMMRRRERIIAKSAFMCAWRARGIHNRMSSNAEIRGGEAVPLD